MSDSSSVEKIIECWRTIDKIIHEQYHKLARQHDLSLEQFHLLLQLEEVNLEMTAGAPTIGQIADAVGNAPHTLTDRIKRLEKKGLVNKTRDSVDQRICRITITDEGRTLISRIVTAAGGDFIRSTLSKMTAADLKKLEASLAVFKCSLADTAGIGTDDLEKLHPLLGLKKH